MPASPPGNGDMTSSIKLLWTFFLMTLLTRKEKVSEKTNDSLYVKKMKTWTNSQLWDSAVVSIYAVSVGLIFFCAFVSPGLV